jgi:FlaA1/EpsC-like NDP-sugar epimerase
VVGSRGSVMPLFLKQRVNGHVTITDPRMTRFWITLEQGVRFVIRCIERMQGGEVFVPKIPSMNIMAFAQAVAPGCDMRTIGIRPGEKLHEVLVSEDEARNTIELDDMFVVQPSHPWWSQAADAGRALPDGYRYGSDNNPEQLDVNRLTELLQELT